MTGSTLVDDPYFGRVSIEVLNHRPRLVTPLCQRIIRCDECDDVYVGVAAFVHHVADRRCQPVNRTQAVA